MKIDRKSCLFTIAVIVSCLTTGSLTLAHSPHDDIYLMEVSPDFDSDKTLFVALINVHSNPEVYRRRLELERDEQRARPQIGYRVDGYFA